MKIKVFGLIVLFVVSLVPVANGCDRLIRAQLVFATICLHNI